MNNFFYSIKDLDSNITPKSNSVSNSVTSDSIDYNIEKISLKVLYNCKGIKTER